MATAPTCCRRPMSWDATTGQWVCSRCGAYTTATGRNS